MKCPQSREIGARDPKAPGVWPPGLWVHQISEFFCVIHCYLIQISWSGFMPGSGGGLNKDLAVGPTDTKAVFWAEQLSRVRRGRQESLWQTTSVRDLDSRASLMGLISSPLRRKKSQPPLKTYCVHGFSNRHPTPPLHGVRLSLEEAKNKPSRVKPVCHPSPWEGEA